MSRKSLLLRMSDSYNEDPEEWMKGWNASWNKTGIPQLGIGICLMIVVQFFIILFLSVKK